MFNNAFGIDFKHSLLTNYLNSALSGMFTRGTWLTKDNFFKQIIPLIASTTSLNEFYDKEVLMKCADNGTNYLNDEQLKLCSLIYVSLSKINHCKSFYLDKRNFKENEAVSKKQNGNQILVINELAISCNDTQTFINELLQEYKIKYPALFFPALNNILALWEKIMNLAKQTKNYNKDFAYSLKQIDEELNTYKEVKIGKKTNKVYDYVVLNTKITAFRKILKDYYKQNIAPKLRKYKLVK